MNSLNRNRELFIKYPHARGGSIFSGFIYTIIGLVFICGPFILIMKLPNNVFLIIFKIFLFWIMVGTTINTYNKNYKLYGESGVGFIVLNIVLFPLLYFKIPIFFNYILLSLIIFIVMYIFFEIRRVWIKWFIEMSNSIPNDEL